MADALSQLNCGLIRSSGVLLLTGTKYLRLSCGLLVQVGYIMQPGQQQEDQSGGYGAQRGGNGQDRYRPY